MEYGRNPSRISVGINLGENQFPMNTKWALNSATIMNCAWDDELKLWQEFGWNAAEIWDSKIQPKLAAGSTISQLAREMQDAGVKPIGLCAGVVTTSKQNSDWAAELNQLDRLCDVAAGMGAPALTVVIIGDGADDMDQEYDFLVDRLRQVAEMAAKRNVLINLEFLGNLPVNGTLGSGIELVNRVNHSSFGLLLDFCHYYVSASHIEELSLLKPNGLFMVHVDDSQRRHMERLSNEQRCFPGEGRIDVVRMINDVRNLTNYDGYLCVELYDKDIWQLDPRDVLARLAASLKKIDQGLNQA